MMQTKAKDPSLHYEPPPPYSSVDKGASKVISPIALHSSSSSGGDAVARLGPIKTEESSAANEVRRGQNANSIETPPNDGTGMPLPVVIPQTSRSFRGAFMSPFVRAYAPALEAHGIDKLTFVTFMDGLNESFVANPVLQGTGVVGAIMTQFYGIHPVQWAGLGLQVASGVASAAISYGRTRAYIKAMNADLFRPAGLTSNILTTKKMMAKVGHPEKKLQLPPLETLDDLVTSYPSTSASAAAAAAAGQPSNPNTDLDDPRVRRVRALEGYVMPIDLDVPAANDPDSFLRRMGHSQAKKLARKQEKKQDKRRRKAVEEYQEEKKKSDKKLFKNEGKIRETQLEMEKEQREFEAAVRKARSEKKQQRIIEDHEEEMSKLQRKIEKRQSKDCDVEKVDEKRADIDKKERKIANKIRWLVISRWSGGDEDEEDEDEVEESGEDQDLGEGDQLQSK